MMKPRFKLFLLSLFCLFNVSILLSAELNDSQKQLLDSLPQDQRENVLAKMMQVDELTEEIDDFIEYNTVTERPQKKELSEVELREYKEKSENWIFGYELFSGSPTTFAPATDIPVPDNYILGPGDELKIQIYGNRSITSNSFISREGNIVIPVLGPVNVVGLTLREVKKLVEQKVTNEIMGSQAYVTIGKLRTINVYILGEAYIPGSYKISSLSTVSNALFVSGGVNEKGSVRNIKIKRNGKTIHNFDFYKLLLEGDTSQDIALQQGDTIFIPLLESTARAYGSFRRPHLFEIKEEDTVEDLFYYAGGLKSPANIDGKFELTSYNKNSIEVLEFSPKNKNVLLQTLKDGDSISASSLSALTSGVIELKGEFRYPGFYQIRNNERLSSVIQRAGGLTDDAFTYGAIFLRKSVADKQKLSFERSADFLEQSMADALVEMKFDDFNAESFRPLSELIKKLRELEPIGRQVMVADLLQIKSDPRLDFPLVNKDSLFIPARPTEITVVGEVLNPSSLSYQLGYRVNDYIGNAGGFRQSADKRGVFLVLPNGESQSYSKGYFGKENLKVVPGTTIVVPRDPSPFSWLVMAKTITPILADSATVIATVKALLD